jgi:molecular chaperone GrpE
MTSYSDPADTPADAHKPEEADAAQGAPSEGADARAHARADKRARKKQRQVLINEDQLKELEEKSKKADEYYGHYVRARADLDNFRKRAQREREDFVKFANEQLLSEIIPIMDNFERAFTAAEKVPETHNFALGVEMILKQLRDALARYGAETIDPAGQPFDPMRHHAAEPVPTTEHPDNTVVEVLHRGYMLNGRVVQPAVVRVAVNPEAGQAAAASEAPAAREASADAGASGADEQPEDSDAENDTNEDTREENNDG